MNVELNKVNEKKKKKKYEKWKKIYFYFLTTLQNKLKYILDHILCVLILCTMSQANTLENEKKKKNMDIYLYV